VIKVKEGTYAQITGIICCIDNDEQFSAVPATHGI